MARRDGQVVARGAGKWLVRWHLGQDDSTGKYRYKSKTLRGNRKDAERELRRVLRSRDSGEYVEPSRVTLNAHLDRFLDGSKGRLAERTLSDYRWLVDHYVRPNLGTQRLDQLRVPLIQEWVGDLGERVSPRTVRLAHAVVSSSLKQAVKWQMLASNQAALVDLPKQERREMRALSGDEVARLRTELAVSPYAVLFDFMLGTGCRPGEVLAVRWADLDLAEGRVQIRRALTRGVDRKPAFKEPKTAGSRRAIPLPVSLVGGLKRHKADQATQAVGLGPGYARDLDLVFANEAGRPLDTRNLDQRHFKPALKRAGLPPVRLYDLRHTHATLLLAAGIHPKVAAERLGHTTTRQTLDTYSHVLPGMQEEATLRIEGAVFGRS